MKNPKRLNIGIDVSKLKLDVCLLDGNIIWYSLLFNFN